MSRCPELLNNNQDVSAGMCGLAAIGDELFVLHYESSSVDVYRASDFVESRQISIPRMMCPVSLAACPHNNCLYISDEALIHRVDLSSSSVSKWSVGDSLWGLSVTINHHLQVTLSSRVVFVVLVLGEEGIPNCAPFFDYMRPRCRILRLNQDGNRGGLYRQCDLLRVCASIIN